MRNIQDFQLGQRDSSQKDENEGRGVEMEDSGDIGVDANHCSFPHLSLHRHSFLYPFLLLFHS